jgi:hypothetical protein
MKTKKMDQAALSENGQAQEHMHQLEIGNLEL